MKTAEVKRKRIKHCYPRKELYHRFIHDDTYVYSPKGQGYHISAIGNYLFYGYIGKDRTIEDINKFWNVEKGRCIAVINRNTKKIIVNLKLSTYYYELKYCIPSDYTIFEINGNIEKFDILDDEEKCHYLHLKNLIEYSCNYDLNEFYAVLSGKKKLVHKDYNDKFYGINKVVNYIKKYPKIKRYSWYNKSMNEKYFLTIYINNRVNNIPIKIPSTKNIITNKIFTKKELDVLDKHYFYTKYCYENGISFKDVINNWNKEITLEEACRYFNKHNIYYNKDWRDKQLTWNDFIEQAINTSKEYIKNKIKEFIKQRNNNYEKACNELRERINKENCDILDSWRNNTIINHITIEYKYFVPNYRKNIYPFGTWKTYEISSRNRIIFPFIQLRLNGNNIETSNYAKVPLDDGIKCYKLFNLWVTNNTDLYKSFRNDYIKVGIYNLRWFKYTEKTSGHKEWQIQIGCHTLWLDDVLDFIHYYHLEDKFDIKSNNEQKKQ